MDIFVFGDFDLVFSFPYPVRSGSSDLLQVEQNFRGVALTLID